MDLQNEIVKYNGEWRTAYAMEHGNIPVDDRVLQSATESQVKIKDLTQQIETLTANDVEAQQEYMALRGRLSDFNIDTHVMSMLPKATYAQVNNASTTETVNAVESTAVDEKESLFELDQDSFINSTRSQNMTASEKQAAGITTWDTEEMAANAVKLKDTAENISVMKMEYEKLMNDVKDVWSGEAANVFMTTMSVDAEAISVLSSNVMLLAETLSKISTMYEDCENKVAKNMLQIESEISG
jgi:uncharacterized protein YukE